MEVNRMNRRVFIRKASGWAVGLGALGLTGALASCSSGSESAVTTSSGSTAASGSTETQNPSQSRVANDTLKAVVTDECAGCGKCTRACKVGAISISGRIAVIGDACQGCGDCVRFCPIGAIVLTRSGSAVSRALAGSGASLLPA